MNDENHSFIVAWICAAVTIVGLAWAVAWYHISDTRARIAAGWVEMPPVPGTMNQPGYWKKP